MPGTNTLRRRHNGETPLIHRALRILLRRCSNANYDRFAIGAERLVLIPKNTSMVHTYADFTFRCLRSTTCFSYVVYDVCMLSSFAFYPEAFFQTGGFGTCPVNTVCYFGDEFIQEQQQQRK